MQNRKSIVALERIVRATERLATAEEKIAAGLVAWMRMLSANSRSPEAGRRSRNGGNGGGWDFNGEVPKGPVPIAPTNAASLPQSGHRPCINVTPAKQPANPKGRLW